MDLFKSRVIVVFTLCLILVSGAVWRVYYLQVLQYEHYTTLSDGNRLHLRSIPPPRGIIYDRNGIALATNKLTYSLVVTPAFADDLYGTLYGLQELLHIPGEKIERFHKERKRQRRYKQVPLLVDISEKQTAKFEVNRHRFPGVEVVAGLSRFYPLKEIAAHAVGYVGRINSKELEKLDKARYRGVNQIGKLGIEKSYEDTLHGIPGTQKVETNARGRTIRLLERTPPIPGQDLYLSIDIELQQVATKALGEHRGAVVAIDPRNGEVLAIVSTPSYDTNKFVGGISSKDYAILRDSEDRPLLNRVLRGQYPPGSTIKPLVALAGLKNKVTSLDEEVYCPGWLSLENSSHKFRDWKRGGHGFVDVEKSLVQSCDIFYYEISRRMGITALHDYLEGFGFGKPTGVDLPGEQDGLLPSIEWKKRVRNKPWYRGETLITGIGQGFFLSTPIQLAHAIATLANDGKGYKPHLLRAIASAGSRGGNNVQITPVPIEANKAVKLHNGDDWQAAKTAMMKVVHSRKGTARRIGRTARYRIAGKTGTAQVFGIKQDEKYVKEEVDLRLRDHALFVAFAPVDTPEIAIAVIVENGGGGGSVAAPIARKVMDSYLND